jgi:NADH dehydrogenase FAD-containing subunit
VSAPTPTRLLLAGGGHAHAIALREWATRRPPGASITLVVPSRWAP